MRDPGSGAGTPKCCFDIAVDEDRVEGHGQKEEDKTTKL
jgi:hypothetical protein